LLVFRLNSLVSQSRSILPPWGMALGMHSGFLMVRAPGTMAVTGQAWTHRSQVAQGSKSSFGSDSYSAVVSTVMKYMRGPNCGVTQMSGLPRMPSPASTAMLRWDSSAKMPPLAGPGSAMLPAESASAVTPRRSRKCASSKARLLR